MIYALISFLTINQFYSRINDHISTKEENRFPDFEIRGDFIKMVNDDRTTNADSSPGSIFQIEQHEDRE